MDLKLKKNARGKLGKKMMKMAEKMAKKNPTAGAGKDPYKQLP